MTVSARPHQSVMVQAIEAQYAAGFQSTMIEAATGTGKTFTFALLIERVLELGLASRILILAHRKELQDQAAKTVQALGLTVARTAAKHRSAQVTVMSPTSVRRRLEEFARDAFDLVVTDEAHHSCAPGYREVYAYFATARRLGVTATPDRADGAGLGQVYETCAYRYGIAEAVRDKILVPARGIRIEVAGMDLSKVRQRTIVRPEDPAAAPGAKREVKDLHPKDLARAAIAPAAVEGVVEPLLQFAGQRRTVVFAVDVAHAQAIAASINARRPGSARAVWGDMGAELREETLRAHKAGEFGILCNVMLLCEGYDDPGIQCVAMCRPTQSRVLYAQCVGRALRLLGASFEESVSAGKTHGLILDFTGVSCEFDLVGPEDVLAGALLEPVRVITDRKSVAIGQIPYDVRQQAGYTFASFVVTLIRGSYRLGRTIIEETGGMVVRSIRKLWKLLFD